MTLKSRTESPNPEFLFYLSQAWFGKKKYVLYNYVNFVFAVLNENGGKEHCDAWKIYKKEQNWSKKCIKKNPGLYLTLDAMLQNRSSLF